MCLDRESPVNTVVLVKDLHKSEFFTTLSLIPTQCSVGPTQTVPETTLYRGCLP